MRISGIVLIVLGFIALAVGNLPYQKTENVAEFGDLKMQVTEKKQFAIPPLVSGAAILVGAALVFVGRRKPREDDPA
jgi:hypothetical protein